MKTFGTIVLIISIFTSIISKNLVDSDNIQSLNEKFISLKTESNIIVDEISDFHTTQQLKYIKDEKPENINLYAHGDKDLSRPKGNKLDFSNDVADSSSYVLQYSSSQHFESDKSKTIKNLKNKIYYLKNLKLNQTIYYRGASNIEGLVNARIHKLTVNSLTPRNLDIPGLDNVRDIGGYKTSLKKGAVIKQGLYYRTARPEGLKEEGRRILSKELGIKREINLRGTNYNPKIEGISYHFIPINNANEKTRFDKYNQEYKKVFDLISEANKYPIMLHCHAGADRTGVMSFALLALLGAEYKDIAKDYAFTSFSTQGKRYVKHSQLETWMDKLKKFEGKNLAEKCKNWLMQKGIKERVLEHIREIFIDGYNQSYAKRNKYFPENFDSLSIDDKYKVVKKLLLKNKIKINDLKSILSENDYQVILKRYLLEKHKN